MVRMLLVGYLGGIRSERKLCAGMHLNLAHRWFCRLGMGDTVPNHSTFSKNRHRRFRDGHVFRAVFEQVVHRCTEAGLVPGASAAVDGSQVDADASRHKRLPGDRVPEAWTTDRKAQTWPVREHLDALDAAVPPGLVNQRRSGTPFRKRNRGITPGSSGFFGLSNAGEYDSLVACHRPPVCPICPVLSWKLCWWNCWASWPI